MRTILLLEQETVVLVANWDALLAFLLLLLPEHLLLLSARRQELLRVLRRHNLREVEGTASLAKSVDTVHFLVVERRLGIRHHDIHGHSHGIKLHLLHLLDLLVYELVVHL